MTQNIRLDRVLLDYNDLFVAKDYKGDGKFRFSATALIEPGSENDKKIRAAIAAEVKDVYGDKAKAFWDSIKSNEQKCSYTDGTQKAAMDDKYAQQNNKMVLRCHSKVRPTVLDRDKTPLTPADGKPYRGCFVTLLAQIYAMKKTNAGLFASFNGVQYVEKGTAFGGATAASTDEFDNLGSEEGDGTSTADDDFDLG